MKQVNFLKLFRSIVLIALVSTVFSYAITGSSSAIAYHIAAVLFFAGLVKGFAGIQFNTGGHLFADGFVITDTTYAGEAASQFIVKAITGMDSMGHVYIKDGIKKKFTIPKIDSNYEDFIQDRAATPTSKGSFDVTGAVLTPADYMIYTEFNPRDYEDHWYATQLNPTLIDRALPYTVESVVIQQVLERHAKYLNKMLWVGDTSLSTIYKYWDGFITKAAASADSEKVTGTTLSAANIQAELLKVYNKIPAALRYDSDMKIFMSYATYDFYMASQIAQTYKGVDTTQEGVAKFKGRTVVKIADFPDDTMIAAKGMGDMKSNLWVGMNSVSDEGLQLARLQANSELFFIKMLMKVDVQIGWESEVVYYGA